MLHLFSFFFLISLLSLPLFFSSLVPLMSWWECPQLKSTQKAFYFTQMGEKKEAKTQKASDEGLVGRKWVQATWKRWGAAALYAQTCLEESVQHSRSKPLTEEIWRLQERSSSLFHSREWALFGADSKFEFEPFLFAFLTLLYS